MATTATAAPAIINPNPAFDNTLAPVPPGPGYNQVGPTTWVCTCFAVKASDSWKRCVSVPLVQSLACNACAASAPPGTKVKQEALAGSVTPAFITLITRSLPSAPLTFEIAKCCCGLVA